MRFSVTNPLLYFPFLSGTQCIHWDEDNIFGDELMTGFIAQVGIVVSCYPLNFTTRAQPVFRTNTVVNRSVDSCACEGVVQHDERRA